MREHMNKTTTAYTGTRSRGFKLNGQKFNLKIIIINKWLRNHDSRGRETPTIFVLFIRRKEEIDRGGNRECVFLRFGSPHLSPIWIKCRISLVAVSQRRRFLCLGCAINATILHSLTSKKTVTIESEYSPVWGFLRSDLVFVVGIWSAVWVSEWGRWISCQLSARTWRRSRVASPTTSALYRNKQTNLNILELLLNLFAVLVVVS